MITKFKIFENTENLNCYGYVFIDSEIEEIYDNIKNLNIDYTFYNAKLGKILYIYTTSDIQKKYFYKFFYQKKGDVFCKLEDKTSDLEEYVIKLNTKKYNL